jgi:lysine-specific demethylase 8
VTEAGTLHPAGAGGLELALRQAGLDVRPIPRAGEATPPRLRQVIAEGAGPVLFPGLADGWPARTAWSPANLVRTHGARRVTALVDLPASGVLFPEDQHAYERSLDFGQFVDRMLAASPDAPCYLAYRRAEEIFPAGDYDFAGLLGGSQDGCDTRVWIGSAGTRSMLHSDLKDNLFCQVWGQKHVVLLPWEQSSAAYPFPDNLVNSRVDLADLDLNRFPRLRRATLYAGTVHPGDVLYMPRGCWHDVRAGTASISINHWFGPPLSFTDYAGLLLRLGPRYWAATAQDFVRHGVMRRRERTRFFFSPPSTGKRLYDFLRWGDFSRDNDPASDD